MYSIQETRASLKERGLIRTSLALYQKVAFRAAFLLFLSWTLPAFLSAVLVTLGGGLIAGLFFASVMGGASKLILALAAFKIVLFVLLLTSYFFSAGAAVVTQVAADGMTSTTRRKRDLLRIGFSRGFSVMVLYSLLMAVTLLAWVPALLYGGVKIIGFISPTAAMMTGGMPEGVGSAAAVFFFFSMVGLFGSWYLSAALSPAIPQMVVLSTPARRALLASWEMTRGHRLRIMGVLLLASLPGVLLHLFAALPVALITSLLGEVVGGAIGLLILLAIPFFTMPILFIVQTVIYIERVDALKERLSPAMTDSTAGAPTAEDEAGEDDGEYFYLEDEDPPVS